MKKKVLIFLLLPGTLCGGQATPTAPGAQTIVCPSGPGPVPAGVAALCPPVPSAASTSETTATPYGIAPGAATVPSGATSVAPGSAAAPTVIAPLPYKVVGPITTRTEFQQKRGLASQHSRSVVVAIAGPDDPRVQSSRGR